MGFTLSKLPSLATMVASCLWATIGSPTTLPFEDGEVRIILDGQPTNLRFDSGSARFFALYGPKYNKTGDCETSKACYFCTPANPCDDAFKRKAWAVEFADGDVFTYVEHNVSVTFGEKVIRNMKMGLVIASFNIHGKTTPPYGLLGLSYGRRGIPEAFLEQLYRLKVIDSVSYSLHTDAEAFGFNGEITLGGVHLYAPKNRLSRDVSFFRRKPTIPLWPLRLLRPDGGLILPKQNGLMARKQTAPSSAIVDTGAWAICMPTEEFHYFIQGTKDYVVLDEDDYIVGKENITYLPTLAYSIGESPFKNEIAIKPNHYAPCSEGYDFCIILLMPGCDTSGLLLGEPLFREYDVGFDLSSERPSLYLLKDARNNQGSI